MSILKREKPTSSTSSMPSFVRRESTRKIVKKICYCTDCLGHDKGKKGHFKTEKKSVEGNKKAIVAKKGKEHNELPQRAQTTKSRALAASLTHRMSLRQTPRRMSPRQMPDTTTTTSTTVQRRIRMTIQRSSGRNAKNTNRMKFSMVLRGSAETGNNEAPEAEPSRPGHFSRAFHFIKGATSALKDWVMN